MPVKEKFLTVEEVAQELRVSTDTVLRLIKRGELPALKVGVKYRIKTEDYERFKDTGMTDKSEKNER